MKPIFAFAVTLMFMGAGPVLAKGHTGGPSDEKNNSPEERGVNQVPPGLGGCAPDCAPGKARKAE